LLHEKIIGLNMHIIGLILLWIAALLTLWSAYEYLRDAWSELIHTPTHPAKEPNETTATDENE